MQLIETRAPFRTKPALTRCRILVLDGDPAMYQALHERLDDHYLVHHSHEIEEAEALITNHLYAVVVARVSLLGNDCRRQLEFVRFVGEQSERTRVILVDGASRLACGNGALALSVDVILPDTPRPCTLALLVSELARST